MANWWDGDPAERYWCEVTDRKDLGNDLHAPVHDQAGREYWSYSLIKLVQPGDVVFHYYTPTKAFVAASIAGGPLRENRIIWQPHGTAGRNRELDEERASWLRPLTAFTHATEPLTLAALDTPAEIAWLKQWSSQVESSGHSPRIPFQLRRDGLRGGQGYLFKMPAAAVNRWPILRQMAEQLEDAAEVASSIVPPPSPTSSAKVKVSPTDDFKPKSDSDYVALVQNSIQHRTRSHERLVTAVGRWLRAKGAEVSTPHPIDLLIRRPLTVIVEAKTTRATEPLAAVRAAVGQLYEYRYFVGPRDALLAILLDRAPPLPLVQYVEQHLGLLLLWQAGEQLSCGPTSAEKLAAVLR